MTDYRIALSQTRIQTVPVGLKHHNPYEKRFITETQTRWSAHYKPDTELLYEFAASLIEERALADIPYQPDPRVVEEQMVLQKKRFSGYLGWKTLEQAGIEQPAFSEDSRSTEMDASRPSVPMRIAAFILHNDPLLNAAKR